MSFDTLCHVEAQSLLNQPSHYPDNFAFDIRVASLSSQISSLNNTILHLSSLLVQVGGRRDNEALRADVKKLLAEAKEAFKTIEEAVKSAQSWEGLSVCYSQIQISSRKKDKSMLEAHQRRNTRTHNATQRKSSPARLPPSYSSFGPCNVPRSKRRTNISRGPLHQETGTELNYNAKLNSNYHNWQWQASQRSSSKNQWFFSVNKKLCHCKME